MNSAVILAFGYLSIFLGLVILSIVIYKEWKNPKK